MSEVLAPPAPAAAAPVAAPAPSVTPSFGSLIQKAADADKAKIAPAAAKPPVKMVDETKPDPIKKVSTPPAPEKAELTKPPEPKVEPVKPTPPKVEGESKPKLSEVLHVKEKRIKELETELEKVKTGKPAEDPEKRVLSERLTKAEARAKELEDEFRYVEYQKSSEFQEKYEKPYNNLVQSHMAEAQELIVDLPDGTARGLTSEEFWSVVKQTDLNSALKVAKEIFPDDPAKVTALKDFRTEIQRSWKTMNAAKEEFRTKGAERAAQKQSEMAETSKAEKARYASEVESVAAEFPEYFKDSEDKAENEQRQKYAKIVDDTLDSDKPNLKNVARLRHAGVNFPIVKARLEKAMARIAELEAKEASRDASVPGAGSPSTEAVGGGAPTDKTMADRIRASAG